MNSGSPHKESFSAWHQAFTKEAFKNGGLQKPIRSKNILFWLDAFIALKMEHQDILSPVTGRCHICVTFYLECWPFFLSFLYNKATFEFSYNLQTEIICTNHNTGATKNQ